MAMTVSSPSLPAWERGLKHTPDAQFQGRSGSLPAWERGLKPKTEGKGESFNGVAPRVGAWIETT